MNEIVNNFLLAGDKFMPEMHLRQPGFNETGDSRYIYQNELDKACVQHDMNCGDFKDLLRRIAPDKFV